MFKVFEKIIEKLQSETESWEDCGKEDNDSLKICVATGLRNAIEIVKEEATQYNNGWIPYSERLPDDTSVCIEALDYPRDEKIVDYGWFVGHRWFVGMYEYPTSIITAWQPLPEPYKE